MAVPAWAAPQIPRGVNLVTILVGAEEKKFTVHKDLLRAASKFLNDEFSGDFEADASGTVRLHDEHPDVVKLMCDWLYVIPASYHVWFPRQLENEWDAGVFWLQVLITAKELLIPGLHVLAFQQIGALFQVTKATIPTRAFTSSLFEVSAALNLQQWFKKHVLYWITWLDCSNGWWTLVESSSALAGEIGKLLVRSNQAIRLVVHTSSAIKRVRSDLEAGNGAFDCAEKTREARKVDDSVVLHRRLWNVPEPSTHLPRPFRRRRPGQTLPASALLDLL